MIKDRLFLKDLGGNYILQRIVDGILTIEGDSHHVIHGITPFHKLSIKNCEAIKLGYDLDELAENKWNELSKQLGLSIQDKAMWCGGFKHGLLELLGDKKFSEEDLRTAFFHVQNEPTFDVFKQSLQQTEWDVEIEMCIEYTEGGYPVRGNTPKLDADGCLILKRK